MCEIDIGPAQDVALAGAAGFGDPQHAGGDVARVGDRHASGRNRRRHFADKSALLAAVATRGFEWLVAELEPAAAGESTLSSATPAAQSSA